MDLIAISNYLTHQFFMNFSFSIKEHRFNFLSLEFFRVIEFTS